MSYIDQLRAVLERETELAKIILMQCLLVKRNSVS